MDSQSNLTGRFLIISSVSGGGKTSIINQLKKRFANLRSAITATTRPMRPGETDGVDYYFYDEERFKREVEAGDFLEHALVHGNYYGVPAGPQLELLGQGYSVILNIDVQGKEKLKEVMPEKIVTIFILPPDLKTWEERLRARQTDSEETIQLRLRDGERELSLASTFDYQVVNDDLNRAVDEISAIIRREGLVEN